MFNRRHKYNPSAILVGAVLTAALVPGLWTWPGYAAQEQAGSAAKTLAKKAAKSSADTTEKQATPKPAAHPAESGLRDPFRVPPPPLPPTTGPVGIEGGCDVEIKGSVPPGTRGLVICQLKLEGIVRRSATDPKLIAVVANSANRAYFLHENDPLYDGAVTKITPDSVYFREESHDPDGKTSSHEVVKSLRSAPGDKQ
jgi:hypothetical protein